jgi:pimeloyl-ACP methyl ester carboxylesterase/S1-C subfamily serine protease
VNDKQRRLIEYFNRLTDPVPPPRGVADTEGVTEEGVLTPVIPIVPPQASPDSVRAMLERQRTAVSSGEARHLEAAIEEGIPFAPSIIPVAGETGNLLRRPEPVERPITDHVIEVAVSAAEKALNDEEMNPEEEDLLEAIILPGLRPVLDVIDGDMSPPPPGWEFLADYRAIIQRLLPAIGRIDVPELITAPYAGTGFFVGNGLLLTNRHVARLFVQGVGAGPKYLTFQSDRSARFDPQYEVGDPDPGAGSDQYEVVEALLVHPHWDAALLRVKAVGAATLPPALPLARHPPQHFGGRDKPRIIVIGYPALDGRSDVAEQMNIFRKIFGRKRLLPGYLTGFRDVATKWNAMLHATTHDASTLGGNSGSAVIDLTTGLVLALHFGGKYLDTNYGVPTWELAQDSRVTDLGVAFANPPNGSSTGQASGAPIWLNAWDGVKPLVPEEVVAPAPAGGAAPPPSETPVLPVAPDWFERTTDTALVEAMRRNPQMTERLIRETLLPHEADDLIADLKRGLQPAMHTMTAEEGIFDFLLGGTETDPTLPEIIFLHGIMGGHLAAQGGLGGRVWLSPLAFVAGGVARRLALSDDGERDQTQNQILYPDGCVRLVYEKAARKWRMRGFVVHEFAYDWRRPIANAADRLHFFIESLRLERPTKKFALVGHSMGGLVAALYASRHPEWSARVTQAILLGAPLRGSFAPIEALLGTYPVLSKVALADVQDDLDDYVAMARTLPGLLDMLPDPDLFPDAAPLYQRITWPQQSAPAQIWLDQSRQLKRLLVSSPLLETARLIVSPGHPTVGDMAVIGGRLQPGRRHRPGDGTVPTRSAAAHVPGVTVYRASFTHGDLPREPAVIDAVEHLLKNGTCDLPVLSQQVIEDVTPIEEAMTESIEEEVSADLTLRLRSGIFTQRDVDFLLRTDHATLPGPVGSQTTVGGA